jgi:hypothetical protein
MTIPIIGGKSKNILPEGHPFEQMESILHAALVSFKEAFDGKTLVLPELVSNGIQMIQDTDRLLISGYIATIAGPAKMSREDMIKMARVFTESYTREVMADIKHFCDKEGIL